MKEPAKKTALVAQAEGNAGTTIELLRQLGWESVAVRSWLDAERLIRQQNFEVLVADYFFRGDEGLSLVTRWREQEIRLRILFVSDAPFQGSVPVEYFGFCGLVLKPLCGEKLKCALKDLLQSKDAAGPEWT